MAACRGSGLSAGGWVGRVLGVGVRCECGRALSYAPGEPGFARWCGLSYSAQEAEIRKNGGVYVRPCIAEDMAPSSNTQVPFSE